MSVNMFNTNFLSPLLQLVSMENKSIVLLGDFNINLLKYDNNSEISSFLDLCESHTLLPRVILPTRITETSKTLIDNIFSNTFARKTLKLFSLDSESKESIVKSKSSECHLVE